MTSKVVVSLRSIQLLRIFVSSIFIIASISHLFNVEKTVRRLESAKLGYLALFLGNPTILVVASGIVMLIAGISFCVGYKTRWSAIVLLAVLIPITITIQMGQVTTLGPLFKNIAILGGLLFFILNDIPKKI
ncbi:DoxX family protein [Arenibacter sp. 6A1]|uniref:DoxX family protein n=1 Tax=Arenibacter sp. 6A1 TaxID=2720391 RepID=UPI0014468952|nr:DoxX family protein [Arenibacter sp. 6A1]NKI27024.1 DoxX family protein [Arenibacter sp. 6A1]